MTINLELFSSLRKYHQPIPATPKYDCQAYIGYSVSSEAVLSVTVHVVQAILFCGGAVPMWLVAAIVASTVKRLVYNETAAKLAKHTLQRQKNQTKSICFA